jgi:predicted nuclease with TOPRIM domain
MDITTIVVTVVTVLGSAGAWSFYQNKMKMKFEKDDSEQKDKNLYRDDLRERVVVLETKLESTIKEKENLLKEMGDLNTKVIEYKVRLEFLEKENDRLKSR